MRSEGPRPSRAHPGITRVVWFTTSPCDHALSILRVVGPLSRAGIEILEGLSGTGLDLDLLSSADLVLLQRDFPRRQEHYERVMEKAHSRGIPVAYEIDDLLLELPPEHPDRGQHYYAPALLPMWRAALEADCVLTSTRTLRARYALLNPNTWLIPNLLNDSIWPQEVLAAIPSHEPLVIGYFGSETHAPDLEEIAPSLERVLRRHGSSVEVHFWGCPPPAGLRDHPQVRWSELHLPRYAEYAAFVRAQKVDIGIAPLRDTEFNRAKSGIKFLEYSAAGVPGVYASVTPYLEMVRAGKTGLLADSPAAWEQALDRLIEDHELRAGIRRQAQAAAYRRWSLSLRPRLWPDTVKEALRSRARGEAGQKRLVASLARQVYDWQVDQQVELAAGREREGALSDVQRQLQQVGAERVTLEAQVESQRETITRLESRVARVSQLEAELVARAQAIEALRASLERMEADIASRDLRLATAGEALASNAQALDERERQVVQEQLLVKALSDELLALKGSTGYAILRLLWRMRLALAPHGSRRERFLQRGMAALRRARQGRPALASLYRLGRPFARAVLPERWRLRLGARAREALGPQADLASALPMRRLLESEAKGAFGTPHAYDVLCFPIIEWDHRFQRPQQLATKLAQHGHRVFYLKLTFHDQGEEILWRQVAAGVFQIQLPGPVDHNRFLEPLPAGVVEAAQSALDRFCWQAGIVDAVTIVELPLWTPLALGLRERNGWKVVYDCMDEHSGLTILRAEMLTEETRLAQSADLVLASSQKLHLKHAPHAQHLVHLPNAADTAHFQQTRSGHELQGLPRPILGYYGAIMEWFDAELVRQAALARPDWSFVLIGQVDTESVAPLRELPNVHFLGEQPYARLPSYLAQFDICLIPFRLTPIIESTDPVKFYEYLSAGKPVVSVPLPELRRHETLFYPASTAEELIAQSERALAENDSQRAAERRAWARTQTWEARARVLEQGIEAIHGLASIIIVSYNGLDHIRACLESILRETHYPRHEVIVVDNGSEREVVRYLQGMARREPRVRLILNESNLGFARANNLGLEAADPSSEMVVLLNNDTVVTRGWLTRLAFWLRDPQVGLVGPVTWPRGVFNQAAVPVSYESLSEMAVAAEGYTHAHWGRSFDIPMLAMYCLALRRDVYRAVGPLDEEFGVGMFEDDDYALRVRAAGYRVVCAEDIYIHHAGRSSFSRLDEADYQKIFEVNRRYFEAKWKTTWQPPAGRPQG